MHQKFLETPNEKDSSLWNEDKEGCSHYKNQLRMSPLVLKYMWLHVKETFRSRITETRCYYTNWKNRFLGIVEGHKSKSKNKNYFPYPSSESVERYKRAVDGDEKISPLLLISLVLEKMAYTCTNNKPFITESKKPAHIRLKKTQASSFRSLSL